MKFQREPATQELFDEAWPLLMAHWKEIAHFQDIPLEPDVELYIKMNESGGLHIFTARDEAGLLVGYAAYFIRSNPHYKSSIQAVQDVIYIDRSRRGFGAKFIIWCDNQLREMGAQAVYQHVKEAHNFGPMLERLGYKLVDLIYTRRLD